MKKKALLVAGIAIVFLSIFFVSCSKESKMCKCTERTSYGEMYDLGLMDPASYGATNCSDLETKLRIALLQVGGNNTYSCN